MITEDYVSFETAKLLKEKGFDWECKAVKFYPEPDYDQESPAGVYAPTLQMAMKWLRKQHNLYVKVEIGEDEGSFWYDFDIIPIGGNAIVPEDDEISIYHEPEEALEAGIKYALENLI